MGAVLTNVGEAWAAGRLAGTVSTDGRYIAWGSGAGEAAKGDVALNTEESESRVGATVTVEGSGAAAAYKVEGTITADGTKTITNAGNFTATTSGTLIVHATFVDDAIDLEVDEQVTFVFTIDPS